MTNENCVTLTQEAVKEWLGVVADVEGILNVYASGRFLAEKVDIYDALDALRIVSEQLSAAVIAANGGN